MTSGEYDGQGIGDIKRMLREVLKKQDAFAQRFDVHAESLEELRKDVNGHTELFGDVLALLTGIVDVVKDTNEKVNDVVERLSSVESKLDSRNDENGGMENRILVGVYLGI